MLAAGGELLRVGLGQHQRLGDEPSQAFGLPRGPARDARPRRAVRVRQAYLQPGADGGQQPTQLVQIVDDQDEAATLVFEFC
jgi:hypothetical protein